MSNRKLVPDNDVAVKVDVTEPGPLIVMMDGGGPPCLRLVLVERRGWVEWTEETHQPGEWHLHWRSGRFKPSDYRSALPNQRVNHLPKSSIITKKDTLHKSLQKFRKTHGAIYDFYPDGFLLPTEYTKFLKEYSKTSSLPAEERPIWICKPADLSRGRGIFLIRDMADLRFDHPAVIQKYIADPWTVGGYKMDLRLYILVTSCHPLRVFLYKEGLVRFGTEKYSTETDLSNLFSHLTNASINRYSSTYDADKDIIGGGSKWTFTRLVEFCKANGGTDLQLVWPRIITLINCTLLMLLPTVPPNDSCFELLGFDVMLDKRLKPWIVEVNCSPALSMDCETDREIKIPLMADMVDTLQMVACEEIQEKQATLDARRRGASVPPPAAKRRSKPSHPRAGPFRPAGARGVRSSGKGKVRRSNSGTRMTSKPNRARSSSRDGAGEGERKAKGGASPSDDASGSSSGAEKKKQKKKVAAGEVKGGEGKAEGEGSGSGQGEGKSDADAAPGKRNCEGCMEGPFGGLVDGGCGNFEQIFPFNDATKKLAETLSASVRRGDAPLVRQECLRDLIGEVRTADKAARKASKQKRAQAKAAAVAAAKGKAAGAGKASAAK